MIIPHFGSLKCRDTVFSVRENVHKKCLKHIWDERYYSLLLQGVERCNGHYANLIDRVTYTGLSRYLFEENKSWVVKVVGDHVLEVLREL